MTITITAFDRSPDGGKGLARDTRVRWALEEVGEPYDVRLVSFPALKQPAHLAIHPFGQIPTYEEGDLVLFESGAIILHIAERHAGLLPDDAGARARAIMWMFAALNTVEPPIVERSMATILELVRPEPEARWVVFYSLGDGPEGGLYYDAHSIEQMRNPLTMLAYDMNGERLPYGHGAPLRLRNEVQLGFKQVKWIAGIEFVAHFSEVGGGYGGYNEDHEFFGYRQSI